MSSSENQLMTSAFQQAGIIVVCFEKGLPFIKLTLAATTEEDKQGRVELAPTPTEFLLFKRGSMDLEALPGLLREEFIEYALDRIEIRLAGGIATQQLYQSLEAHPGNIYDVLEAAEWFDAVRPLVDFVEQSSDEIRSRTKSLFQSPEVWSVVEKIARILLERGHIEYEQAKQVYESLSGRKVKLRWA